MSYTINYLHQHQGHITSRCSALISVISIKHDCKVCQAALCRLHWGTCDCNNTD